MENFSLLERAQQHLAASLILRADLPHPYTIAIELEDGTKHCAASCFVSMTLGSNAAPRLLYRLLQTRGTPRIAAIAFAHNSRIEPLLIENDLKILAPFCAKDTLIIGLEVCSSLSKKLQSKVAFSDAETQRVTLHTARQQYTYHTVAGVQSLTPTRAALLDIYEQEGANSYVEKVTVTLKTAPKGFPLSGRDVQDIRRAANPATLQFFLYAPQQAVVIKRLEEIMPASYRSTAALFGTNNTAFWKIFSKEKLHSIVAEILEVKNEKIVDRFFVAQKEALLLPRIKPFRAAIALSTKGEIFMTSNHSVAPFSAPSCAESNAIKQLKDGKIAAILLLIQEENGAMLMGEYAAPCGFCRENIIRCCTPQTLVIISDNNGNYTAANALETLPFHTIIPS